MSVWACGGVVCAHWCMSGSDSGVCARECGEDAVCAPSCSSPDLCSQEGQGRVGLWGLWSCARAWFPALGRISWVQELYSCKTAKESLLATGHRPIESFCAKLFKSPRLTTKTNKNIVIFLGKPPQKPRKPIEKTTKSKYTHRQRHIPRQEERRAHVAIALVVPSHVDLCDLLPHFCLLLCQRGKEKFGGGVSVRKSANKRAANARFRRVRTPTMCGQGTCTRRHTPHTHAHRHTHTHTRTQAHAHTTPATNNTSMHTQPCTVLL